MSLPVAVVVTLWFAGCGGYAAVRSVRSGGRDRVRYLTHVAMAAAMIGMGWIALPSSVLIAVSLLFALETFALAVEASRTRHWLGAQHAVMAGLMTVMCLVMVPPRGHVHHDMAGMDMAAMDMAGTTTTGGSVLRAALLLGAVALVPLSVAAVDRARRGGRGLAARDRVLERAASLGMAVGAAAMALH